MKVTAIRPAGRADVYNMEVADMHNYAIANGVIVHNCRYLLMENPISPRLPAKIQPKPANPLESARPRVFRV